MVMLWPQKWNMNSEFPHYEWNICWRANCVQLKPPKMMNMRHMVHRASTHQSISGNPDSQPSSRPWLWIILCRPSGNDAECAHRASRSIHPIYYSAWKCICKCRFDNRQWIIRCSAVMMPIMQRYRGEHSQKSFAKPSINNEGVWWTKIPGICSMYACTFRADFVLSLTLCSIESWK